MIALVPFGWALPFRPELRQVPMATALALIRDLAAASSIGLAAAILPPVFPGEAVLSNMLTLQGTDFTPALRAHSTWGIAGQGNRGGEDDTKKDRPDVRQAPGSK